MSDSDLRALSALRFVLILVVIINLLVVVFFPVFHDGKKTRLF